MYLKKRITSVIIFLIFIIFVFLGIAVYSTYPWYIRTFVGESSAATWLSSSLLVMISALTLVNYIFDNKILWFGVSSSFFYLACDEKFMLHEQYKEYILFNIFNADLEKMGLWGEFPIFVYMLIGVIVFYFLLFQTKNIYFRVLLVLVLLSGLISFSFDVLKINALIEDIFKIITELLFLIAMYYKISLVKNKQVISR